MVRVAWAVSSEAEEKREEGEGRAKVQVRGLFGVTWKDDVGFGGNRRNRRSRRRGVKVVEGILGGEGAERVRGEGTFREVPDRHAFGLLLLFPARFVCDNRRMS